MFEAPRPPCLDIDQETYPFVTSSSCTAGGAATRHGCSAQCDQNVIGVPRRTHPVGGGPFPAKWKAPSLSCSARA